MKEKKISFWTFFKVLNWNSLNGRNNLSSTNWATVFSALFIIICISWLGGHSIPLICIVAVFTVPAICVLMAAAKIKPSMFDLMPIGFRRKTVFLFLSMGLTTLIFMLVTFAIIAFATLIFALLILVTTGTWPLVIEESSGAVDVINMGVQGHLLGVIITVLIVGLALCFSSIEGRYARQILTCFIPVFVSTPLWIIMGIGSIPAGDLFVKFSTISLSYVYLIILAVISIALVVIGSYRIIKLLKPKQF